MSKIPTVFCDLDSTLANTEHRHWIISEARAVGAQPDWTAYSLACKDDTVIEGTVTLLRLLSSWCDIVLLSGRDVKAYDQTIEWLQKNDVPFTDLLLREKAQRQKQGEYKLGRLLDWQMTHPFHEVVLHIDDWHEVGDHLAKAGVPVLFVNPMYAAERERQLVLDTLM